MPAFTGRHGDSGEIEVAITAPAITVAGQVAGATGTISGLLTVGTLAGKQAVGTITGALNAGTVISASLLQGATGTITGALNVSGNITSQGLITGTAGTVAGAFQASGGITSKGLLTGTTGTVAGAFNVGGAISGGSGTVVGLLTAGTVSLGMHPTLGSGAGAMWGSMVPAFGTNQAYLPINIGTVTYRIPLWADA